MAGMSRRTYLRDVNPYLICPLCRGYLVDATTVVECLHSFCRSCILKHLSTDARCPTCNHDLNNAKPDIKADKALQDIVYKLVPGLYHKEMRKRREFYKKHPEYAECATPEQRGEDVSGRLIFAPEDAVSLSLEYLAHGADPLTLVPNSHDMESMQCNLNNNNSNGTANRRYLQCPALVTIAHLKKFLALKYSVDLTRYTIEVCHRTAPLPEHWTLMDVAYMYAWKRNAPMRFFYRIAQEEPRLEAPPHDRPSTPGLGASLPPVDTTPVVNPKELVKAEKKPEFIVDKKESPRDRPSTPGHGATLPSINSVPVSATLGKQPVAEKKREVIKDKPELPQIKNLIKIVKNPDKKQFLQSFQLTARESRVDVMPTVTPPKATTPKIDVYTFPSDPPLPPGAVKRKCPPGLSIFESKRRKLPFLGQPKKLTVKPLNRSIASQPVPKNSQTNLVNSVENCNSVSSSIASPPEPVKTGNAKSTPNLNSNTRNLLDGCGLNIPASLSITLTAPKSPNNTNTTGSDCGNSKDSQISLVKKVNPSITLNDRSVDPRVLKALKTGQIRMPAPSKFKPKNVEKEVKINPKRRKDPDQPGDDALDLSGVNKINIHPLRIPQPVSSKSKAKAARENNTAQGHVVTLVSGQRYYRAPPGFLTPAAHRVKDIPLPTPTRAPVYAPSCLSSPTSSGRSNLSSVFPSLQSLFALSQAQNRQKLQIEARLRLPQTDGNAASSPSKSHLAAQCAPIKPARSSVSSLAVPIIKPTNNATLPCEGPLR